METANGKLLEHMRTVEGTEPVTETTKSGLASHAHTAALSGLVLGSIEADFCKQPHLAPLRSA